MLNVERSMTSVATLWVDHPAEGSPAAEALRVEQIAVISRQSGALAAVGALCALLLLVALWDRIDPIKGALWTGAIFALSGYWLLRWWPGRREAKPAYVGPQAAHRVVYAALATGAAWGAAAFLAFPAGSDAHKMFLCLVLGAVAGGSAVALASLPAAALACMTAMLAPLLVRLALEGGTLPLSLAALGVVYQAAVLTFVRSIHASFIDTVGARMANAELMDELQSARRDLLDAIASTSEAFGLFDERRRLVVCNRNYGAFLSIPAEELLVGARHQDLLRRAAPPEEVARGRLGMDEWLTEVERRQAGESATYVQKLANGRWLQTSDRRTSRGGIVSVHVDITALKEREQALERARVEAEEANRAKSEFLALMSHELRTPLNAILGFSELVRDEVFGPHSDARYREYADDINRSGGHLLAVINDILDLSKIEAGRYELGLEEVRLLPVVEDLKRLLGERVRRGDLTLEIALEDPDTLLLADPRALKQMLLNLLSNAIKFTPAGGNVRLTSRRHDGMLEVAVTDTGIGIAPEDLERVMEPFRQAGNALTREYEGTGLGLPLVRSLINLHGGSIALESTPGVGTTARLRFPLQPAA